MSNTRSGEIDIVYPNNYGGTYIKNGEVAILIKGDVTQNIENEYQDRTKSTNIRVIL